MLARSGGLRICGNPLLGTSATRQTSGRRCAVASRVGQGVKSGRFAMFAFCSPSVLWLNTGVKGGDYADRFFFVFWDFAAAGGFLTATAFAA
jgi:hypothetical protein